MNKIPCPQCGKLVDERGMGGHLFGVHLIRTGKTAEIARLMDAKKTVEAQLADVKKAYESQLASANKDIERLKNTLRSTRDKLEGPFSNQNELLKVVHAVRVDASEAITKK